MKQRNSATIADVARRAGVSRASVSKVIRHAYGVSTEMQDRVNAVIRELDYRPSTSARSIRGQSFTLGFELHELENPALDRILRGAAQAVGGTGYQLVVAPAMNADPDEYRAVEALVDLRVDGIVAVSPLISHGWLESLARRVSVVMLSRHDVSAAYDTIAGNDDQGTRLAMEHLFGLGHVRISHLTRGGDVARTGSGTPHSVRLGVYRDSMVEHGYHRFGDVVQVGPSKREAVAAVRALLERDDRPTAIFAAHDELALGALRAIDDLGLSAADVSVVGYDDIPVANHPRVSLTTVDQCGDELGSRAVQLLLERIHGRTQSRYELTVPQLRIRGSTGPAHG